jgi:hypothetical protein
LDLWLTVPQTQNKLEMGITPGRTTETRYSRYKEIIIGIGTFALCSIRVLFGVGLMPRTIPFEVQQRSQATHDAQDNQDI